MRRVRGQCASALVAPLCISRGSGSPRTRTVLICPCTFSREAALQLAPAPQQQDQEQQAGCGTVTTEVKVEFSARATGTGHLTNFWDSKAGVARGPGVVTGTAWKPRDARVPSPASSARLRTMSHNHVIYYLATLHPCCLEILACDEHLTPPCREIPLTGT